MSTPVADAYFIPIAPGRYRPTDHVGGGWNPDEQHIAPVMGLLAREIETHHASRRTDVLTISRATYDIHGVLPMDAFDISVEVIRPGRTIELVEATLTCQGRIAITLRAWLLATSDTSTIAGDGFPSMPPLADTPPWDFSSLWPGGFVRSVETRQIKVDTGQATSWVRPGFPLIADAATSPLARMLGVVDVANGLCPRRLPGDVAFPNVDLTAHILRAPESGWLGLASHASFGPAGLGVTHSTVYDERGPVAVISQSLTVRPKAAV